MHECKCISFKVVYVPYPEQPPKNQSLVRDGDRCNVLVQIVNTNVFNHLKLAMAPNNSDLVVKRNSHYLLKHAVACPHTAKPLKSTYLIRQCFKRDAFVSSTKLNFKVYHY